MKFNVILIFFTINFLLLIIDLNAQNNSDSISCKKIKDEFKKNEIGLANSTVYITNERIATFGIHLHYIKLLNNSKFGIGFGYERIFDKHKHNTLGIVVKYIVVDGLSLNISPGIKIEDSSIKKAELAMHTEVAYDVELRNLCFGPVFEIAFDKNNIHLSLGLHIGLEF